MKKSIFTQFAALSRREAARYLRCSIRQIDKFAADGQLKRCKLGRRTVFQRSELDRFLALRSYPTSIRPTDQGPPELESLLHAFRTAAAAGSGKDLREISSQLMLYGLVQASAMPEVTR